MPFTHVQAVRDPPAATRDPDGPGPRKARPSPGSGSTGLCACGAGGLALVLARRLLHGSLYLLEGAHLDLADALARDAELGRKVLQGRRLLGEPPCLENALLAVVQRGKRARQVALAPV